MINSVLLESDRFRRSIGFVYHRFFRSSQNSIEESHTFAYKSFFFTILDFLNRSHWLRWRTWCMRPLSLKHFLLLLAVKWLRLWIDAESILLYCWLLRTDNRVTLSLNGWGYTLQVWIHLITLPLWVVYGAVVLVNLPAEDAWSWRGILEVRLSDERTWRVLWFLLIFVEELHENFFFACTSFLLVGLLRFFGRNFFGD